MAARPHVAPPLPCRGDQLERDLPDEEHERARDVRAVRHERAVTGIRPALVSQAADRQERRVRASRQQVAAAGAAAGEQAVIGSVPPLDLRAVVGIRAGHHPGGLLLHPAERGNVVVRSEQDAGLAGAGLRREIGLPLDERVASVGEPARQRRRRPRRAPRGEGRAARGRRSRGIASPGTSVRTGSVVRRAIRRVTRNVYSSSSFTPAITANAVLDRGCHQRDEQRRAEVVDLQRLRRDVARQLDDRRVEAEHEQEPGDRHERQAQRRDEGRQHRVEHRHDRRHHQGAREAVHLGAGQPRRGEQEGQGRQDPGDRQPQRTQPRGRRAPSQRLLGIARRLRHTRIVLQPAVPRYCGHTPRLGVPALPMNPRQSPKS